MSEGNAMPGIGNGELLEAIFDSSDDAILSKKLDGTITSWNPASERIYGWRAEEAVGQNVKILAPDEEHEEEIDEFLTRIAAGEKIAHVVTARKTKDGRIIRMGLSISPVRNAEGKVIGASSIGHELYGDERRMDEMRQLVLTATGRAKSVDKLAGLVREYNDNVQGLTKTLGGFVTQDEVNKKFEKRQKSQRNQLIGLAVSVLLDIILSVILAVTLVRGQQVTEQVKTNQAGLAAAQAQLAAAQTQLTTACEAGNEARVVEQQLWTYVLDLSSHNPTTTRTPAEQQRANEQIAQFKQYLATTFAPRACPPK